MSVILSTYQDLSIIALNKVLTTKIVYSKKSVQSPKSQITSQYYKNTNKFSINSPSPNTKIILAYKKDVISELTRIFSNGPY
jgi:thymidylate kinase